MTCGRIFRCFDDSKYIGPAGKGVSSAVIDANGHLIITYTDGTTSDAGLITGGGSGVSITGATVNGVGHLVLTLSDGSTVDAGYVVGPAGPAGSGVGITGATVNGSGHLILTFSDSSTVDAGYVVGPQGPAGSGSGTAALRTFYASQYATAQAAIDAAKGQRLILDKEFTVSATVTMLGAAYNGTVIEGTDQLGTGFAAGQALNGPVLDVRASNVILRNFTVRGANFPNTGGIYWGDRQTQTYQAKKCACYDIIVRQTSECCMKFFDQIDYIDFFNLRMVDENTGYCIYIDNPAGTVYDNGNLRFYGSFFSSVNSIMKRNAISGTFHRLNFFGCQFSGSHGATYLIDLTNIHECTFTGCTFETSGGTAPSAMLRLSGINQVLEGCTFSGNGNTPSVGVISVDPAYGPYSVLGISIQNWSATTVGWYASSPVRVSGAEDTIFVGTIGTKFSSSMIVGTCQYNPSQAPTLNCDGSIGIYYDGSAYKLAARINGQTKTVTLT